MFKTFPNSISTYFEMELLDYFDIYEMISMIRFLLERKSRLIGRTYSTSKATNTRRFMRRSLVCSMPDKHLTPHLNLGIYLYYTCIYKSQDNKGDCLEQPMLNYARAGYQVIYMKTAPSIAYVVKPVRFLIYFRLHSLIYQVIQGQMAPVTV